MHKWAFMHTSAVLEIHWQIADRVRDIVGQQLEIRKN